MLPNPTRPELRRNNMRPTASFNETPHLLMLSRSCHNTTLLIFSFCSNKKRNKSRKSGSPHCLENLIGAWYTPRQGKSSKAMMFALFGLGVRLNFRDRLDSDVQLLPLTTPPRPSIAPHTCSRFHSSIYSSTLFTRRVNITLYNTPMHRVKNINTISIIYIFVNLSSFGIFYTNNIFNMRKWVYYQTKAHVYTETSCNKKLQFLSKQLKRFSL